MFTGKYNNASYMTKENKGKSLTSPTKGNQMMTASSASQPTKNCILLSNMSTKTMGKLIMTVLQ